MRNRQTQISFILALGVFFAALISFDAGAQQQIGNIQPTTLQSATQDGPVAITPKTTTEKGPPEIVITPEDFGNFRFPLINNKGEKRWKC